MDTTVAINPSLPVATTPEVSSIGLYVHIPFCYTKCTYCDFNTYAGIEHLMEGVIDALDSELHQWSSHCQINEFGTVFFGGGTPSYIPPTSISRLLNTAGSCYGISADAEITIEANPDDIDIDRIIAWHEAGVNRLSIGVQSFNDAILTALSRRHSAEDALEAIQLARRYGISNVSIDLMYGLPQQSLADWKATLDRAIELRLPHLSLYCLQIEPNTPMAHSVAIGNLPRPDDDLAADMYEFAMDSLAIVGYDHYEISNWCLPGMRSAHNLGYWRNSTYLGVGPGAHSSLEGTRFWNVKSPKTYTNAIKRAASTPFASSTRITQGMVAIEGLETTSKAMQMSETMMLGLRLREGVSISSFNRRYQVDLLDLWSQEIGRLSDQGLVESDNGWLRLTRRGRLLGNEVFLQFV